MEKIKKDLYLTSDHRGNRSTSFTGRPEGKGVRSELGLDHKDSDNYIYQVYIPKGTTSFNASFFLGLFFKSIEKLGSINDFKTKYEIKLDQLEEELRLPINRNLKECFRKAENELNKTTGLD